jgi:hypothetical protein
MYAENLHPLSPRGPDDSRPASACRRGRGGLANLAASIETFDLISLSSVVDLPSNQVTVMQTHAADLALSATICLRGVQAQGRLDIAYQFGSQGQPDKRSSAHS